MVEVRCGFDGKLPSRGDFVGRGLPRGFTMPWQEWVEAALAASRAALADGWVAAWLEAPIWGFALPGGACGPDAALGLLLPSVDRAGRYYPLTVAAVFPGQTAAPDPEAAAVWLDHVTAVALDAIAHDIAPDALADTIATPDVPHYGERNAGAVWWTLGSPRVPARRMELAGLPAPSDFAGMIDAGPGG